MLKGELFTLNITTNLFAVVFCLIIIGILAVNVTSQANFFGVVAQASIEEMSAIDAANILKDCFSSTDGYIEASFLAANNGNNVCDINECQLCQLDIGLRIRDLEKDSGNDWSFGFDSSSGTEHEIFVNIRYVPSEVHVGK
ncbi:MAG: hypothetical protein ACYSR0_12925, partial [Planctomycetota bacterium]